MKASVTKAYYEDSHVQIFHVSAFKALAAFPPESFDCVVTDPPYWTLDKHRGTGTTTRLGGNREASKQSGWFKTIDHNELMQFASLVYTTLKKNHHAYVMSDGQTLRYALNYFGDLFDNVKPLVWDKVNQGMGYHYRCRHEFFLMCDKGKNRQTNSKSVPDVWTVPMIRGGYPTEKPVELMKIPIANSTNESDLVCDPFMGGGSTLVAVKQLNRRAIGFDISEEACELAAKRCQETLL